MIKNRFIYILIVILLFIDQIIKYIVRSNMFLYQKIVLIKKFFSIYYVENEGAAFSIFNGYRFLLIIVGLVVLFVLNYYISKYVKINRFNTIYYGMIFSGIYGNLIDRIFYGRVIDYLSFNIFNYSFPIFNFADICIVIGVVTLLFDYLRGEYYGN